jgi:AcrR family transcriptional regulator
MKRGDALRRDTLRMAVAALYNAEKAARQPLADDEALRVLAREGRNGLRIGRLCAALGVTSGSFYHHFGGWDGFVAALLEHWEREEVGRIVELVNASDDPLERVRRMKHLALTVPHEAETAIRAWATVDPVVEAAQRAVDRGRLHALADVLAAADEENDAEARADVGGRSDGALDDALQRVADRDLLWYDWSEVHQVPRA